MKKISAIAQKAMAVNSQPTEGTFPELPKVLVWMRFVIGVAYGLYLGMNNVRSGVMILQAANLIVFLPLMYVRFYLGVGQDHFASATFFSGTFNALALWLLIWIYMFTAQHEADEALIAKALGAIKSAGPEAPLGAVVDEPEF